MAKLHSKTGEKIIPARELKDGQIGFIVQHPNINLGYIGRIVQNYKNERIITIGMESGCSFGKPSILSDDFKVRVLDNGELIEVVNN